MLSVLLVACLVACLASCLWMLVGQLPVQNIAAICAIIGGLAWIESRLPWPGPSLSRPEQQALLHTAIWITVILVARSMARLILSHRRGLGAYGIWVWLLATLLATQLVFGIAILPAAVEEAGLHQAPGPLRIAHWAVTSLVMFICVSPWLIRKHPQSKAEPRSPLLLWLGANMLFVATAVQLRLWVQASVILAVAVVAAVLAERARSGHPNEQFTAASILI
jgi:hypothetical protein